MISLKVSCSLFRYFCTICHIPKLALWKRIWVTFLNLFSTKSIAWDSQMWAVALCNPTNSQEEQANDCSVSANTFCAPQLPPWDHYPFVDLCRSICVPLCRTFLPWRWVSKTRKPFHGLLLSFASSTEGRPWAWAIRFYVPGCSCCYFCSCKISVLLTGINLPKLGRPERYFRVYFCFGWRSNSHLFITNKFYF